ncbi:MAG: type ISP restriction/modification enzyme, partial [Galactobacter sp.]
IRSTYADRTTATNKNSLYDSYIRAIRWASNRVLGSEHGGVVCYVSNGGYIDGNTADGLRKTLTDEFHEIYVHNLRGNTRTSGVQAHMEGGQIFGAGSRATVAILLLVKRPGKVKSSVLHYKDIGDYLDRDTKLELVGDATLDNLDWETITPNEAGDWINQRDPNYESYPPIADKDKKNKRKIFDVFGRGLETGRDVWVYNSSRHSLEANVSRMIENYNAEVERWIDAGRPMPVEQFIDTDPTKISWARSLRGAVKKETPLECSTSAITGGIYRPFQKQNVYFAKLMNHERGQMPKLFPTPEAENFGFYNVGSGSAVPFSVLMTNAIPDLHVTGAGSGGQFFARYSYTDVPGSQDDGETLFAASGTEEGGPQRVDNITDWAQAQYRAKYGEQVTKDDVFFYVYGLLHSPEYRERYASDLKKQLPRIPMVEGRDRFEAFVAAGRRLSELHIGYESLEPYPLTEAVLPGAPEDEFERFRVEKMKYAGKSGAWDKTQLKYNRWVTLSGIPESAQEYMLGSRSALDWIVERYRVKTDKASGIVNDPNDWSREHNQPRYIIDLIGRVVALSLETQQIVNELPELVLLGANG